MARQTREEREQEVRAQYEAVTDRLFSDKAALKAYLSFSGRHYKLPADHAMMVFHANPNADMVTDYDTWQRLGRQVERGQRSIAAFENGKLRHYFDISQTKGREIQPRWRFDSKLAAQYVEAYSTQAGFKFSTLTDCIDALTDEHTASAAQAAAKEFGISPEQERNFVKSVTMMARAVVAARCGYQSGFKYRSADLIDKYPWAMDMLQDKAQKEQLLALVQRSAKGALLSMEKTVNDIQRRNTYEQGYDSKRRSPNMVRGGQEALPRDNQGKRQDVQARPDDVRLPRAAGAGADGRGAGAAEAPDRALRDSVAALHGGESPAGDTRAQGQNEVGDYPSSDRRGSRGNGVEHGAGVRAEESATHDVPGDSGMGENEAARGGTQGDDRPSASAQSINSTTATAEDNSPAVSVLEFIDLASYALYENSTVRSAHENSDQANYNLAVRAAVNSYFTSLISGQEKDSLKYSVGQLAPLYDKFQQDKDFREEVFSAVAERVDKLLIELGRARTKAAELGIPFSDRIYDPNDPEEQSNDPYSYDGSMSVEDSRKAAAANNLHEFMSGYSDELKMAAASYSADEFRRYFADRAARALESNTEHYLDSLRSDRDYLNSVCDLVSPSVYNELREDIQQVQQEKITYPAIYVNGSYNRNFSPEEVGFKVKYPYTVEEFNAALNQANEIWNNDEKYLDSLHSVSVSVYASRTESLTYDVELYASYHSIGEIIDEKQSIAPLSVLSKLKAAISEIENKQQDDIPDDIDKFYVNAEAENVTWVRYNPDSDAGGQFVYTYISFDDIFDAMEQEDPMEYLTEHCKQELLDRGAEGFDVAVEKFKSDSEDISSRDRDYLSKLFALTEPRYAIFQLKDDEKLRDYHFANSEHLKNHGMYIDRENYDRVYRGRLQESETLDDIYNRFNDDHPQDFRGHSLSVGDIVAVNKNGSIRAYFVDSYGFTVVPDFTLSREERKARRALTDNIGLLAEKQLASDEMDDLVDKLFNYDHAPVYSGITNWTMGASLSADEFEVLTTRFHNGEDISAELAKKIYWNMQFLNFEYPPADGISRVEISSEKTDTGMTFRTKGGFEVSHTWEALGNALITAARQEFDRHEQLDRAYSLNETVQEEKAWTPYIISDLKTWADNSTERASLERYNTFEEAKARFDELRIQQYNSEETRNADGIPYARLTLGIETKNGAVDIIHVREGQNYLVDDFTRQPSILTNSSAMELINRAESEIGFDRVFSYKKLDNGSYDNGTDLSFSEWNEKNRLFAEQPKEQAESKAEPEMQAQSGDFRITDETVLGEGGLKTKYQNNIAAITTLKAIESESRSATPEEQKILAKYAGWGGMPQVFDRANEQWSKEYRQLRGLLADDEYKAAAESTLNAHYTSPEIISAMYKALGNFGFSGGNVLEPAMGVGNFFGCMPQGMSSDSKLYGVELDSITGRIAKQLYPQADIRVQGYEKAAFADNFFDAAVGNVPFGNYGVADKRYDKERFLIHDYFFAKTLDKVAPNGIVAFITSKGTLDKQNPKVREYLAKRADLIGAIRLPNNAFKANAGTEVTADIIFLQKREKMAVEPPDWCYTAENSNGVTVNQYFIDHPEMVLGKLEYTTGPFGQETTCTPIEGEKLSEQLERAVSNLHAQAKQQKREVKQNKEQGVIPATDDVRNFTHALVDGKLYFRENNIMRQVTQTGKDLKRMIGLHELRQTMVQLIEAQNRSCTDVELQSLQLKLDTQYESFKKSFGSINDRLNANVFRADDDYNTLCSLEIIDPEKKTTEKSDIFTQRTIKPNVEVTHVDTPQEAMQVSMDVKGRVDIGYMSALCGSSNEDIVAELSESALILPDPARYDPEKPLECYVQSSEYLSGNVRNKLRAAQYAAKENPELFSRNVTELENVIPPDIEAGEITARLGASWVDVEDYEDFLHEYIGRSVYYINLRRTISGEYKLENKTSDRSAAATSIYGTERLSAYHIFENLLNHRDIKVTDRIELGDGKCRYELNKDETQLANEKARQMSEAFSRWLWDNPARRSKYTERYNELFNSIVGRNYDGAHQTFPGMSPYIQLKPHQKDAVARAKYGGNTLLAHCVGAGKSFEMIAATMEKKRLGLINKACVVVPKALVGQTANEWLRLYPQAKILVAGDKDFSKDNRQKFIGRCCTGDYAAVVMSYEQFEKIPMSLEYKRRFLERELETVQQGLEELSPIRDRASVKDLQQEQKRIRAKIERLLEGGKTKDNSLTFEQLGFDSLVVDEAHNYKNGLVVSKMSNISGVTTNPAQKSEDILMKTQYLNETYGNKNILFATGTPVTNSMTELYTMQRYLRPDLLERARLQTFDDWAGNFGEVVSQLELKPAGDGFRTKKRFAKFSNLPELMQMYKEFADIRTQEMLNLPVPEITGGKPQTIVAQPDEFQKAYVQLLAARSEAIHSGAVEQTEDNMLKITHEARLLGLDARCINPEAENSPTSKVNLCIDKVMEIYKKTEEQKGVQAIFCDIAVNDDDGKFSVYNYIREELQRRGVPASEICAAGDAKNQEQRNEMFSELRAGKKRIVISSTAKLGTGANIQTRLAALHNLDIPWKPSDLEQRNGRIIRQGNSFSEVGVYNYVTENTFDAYMMNIIVTKQKFISQLMSGKTPARTCEDVDEMVLNYSEMQALATGDPRIKEKIELDMDVSQLRTLESAHYNDRYKMQDVIRGRTSDLSLAQIRLEKLTGDKEYAAAQPADFSVKLNGSVYTERAEAAEVIAAEAVKCITLHSKKTLGEYKGFELSLEPASSGSASFPVAQLKRTDGLVYSAPLALDNNLGNVTRIENAIKTGIDKAIAACEERIESDKADIAQAQKKLDMPFEFEAVLKEKTARLEQLNAELDCGRSEEVFAADDELTEPAPTQKKAQAHTQKRPKK